MAYCGAPVTDLLLTEPDAPGCRACERKARGQVQPMAPDLYLVAVCPRCRGPVGRPGGKNWVCVPCALQWEPDGTHGEPVREAGE